MRRSVLMTVILGLAVVGACKKGEDTKKDTSTTAKTQESGGTAVKEPGKDTPAPAKGGDPVASVGVEAGGIQRDAKEGPAAVITAVKGTVEVRRVGETTFGAAKADTQLYPGDAIRTGDASSATVALADESVVEVAEVTTLGIASREGTADPASSAAVLAGLARFTVTARVPGEGPFRVYTPAGVIVTKGTTYGVGVSASGSARVGVETGSVDVIGLADLAATPIVVEGGSSAVIEANGSIGAPAKWPADDWGVWRDESDAKIEVVATVDAHAQAMADLNAQLLAAYADLDAAADSIATFEANAAIAADKKDTAAYEASLPDGSATIDASFSLAGQIEFLTWANYSHAVLATDLYVRHPDVVVTWDVVAPRVDAAILWPKRYEVTAAAYFEPLRFQYYVHHPVGRLHAPLVGVTVPTFYATVQPPAIDVDRVRGRVKTKIWMAPEVRYTAGVRPVWISAPNASWRANIKTVSPAPFRASGGWYARPPEMKSKFYVGANVKGKFDSKLKVNAPAPRASLTAAWKIPVGMKIKVGAPDLSAAANARAKFKVGAGMNAGMGGGADVKGKVGGKLNVQAPEVRAPDVKAKVNVVVPDVKAKVKVVVPDVKAKVGVGINAGANAGADAKAKAGGAVDAGAKVKVQAPAVKIKAPSIKVKGKAEGGFKIGG